MSHSRMLLSLLNMPKNIYTICIYIAFYYINYNTTQFEISFIVRQLTTDLGNTVYSSMNYIHVEMTISCSSKLNLYIFVIHISLHFYLFINSEHFYPAWPNLCLVVQVSSDSSCSPLICGSQILHEVRWDTFGSRDRGISRQMQLWLRACVRIT